MYGEWQSAVVASLQSGLSNHSCDRSTQHERQIASEDLITQIPDFKMVCLRTSYRPISSPASCVSLPTLSSCPLLGSFQIVECYLLYCCVDERDGATKALGQPNMIWTSIRVDLAEIILIVSRHAPGFDALSKHLFEFLFHVSADTPWLSVHWSRQDRSLTLHKAPLRAFEESITTTIASGSIFRCGTCKCGCILLSALSSSAPFCRQERVGSWALALHHCGFLRLAALTRAVGSAAAAWW